MHNSMNSKEQNGPMALITGSSSGIGLGIAKAFAARGIGLIVHGIEKQAELDELATHLRLEYNVPVHAHSADLTQEADVKSLLNQLERNSTAPDILVNNAGVQFTSRIEDFPIESWRLLLELHLTAPFQFCKGLLPSMRAKGWGRIINISSVHGLVASVQKSAYVAAKHGLIGFTKTLALETAGSGITANAICPGWVKTPLVEAQIQKRATADNISFAQATEAMLGEKQPSKTFVNVDEIAALATFLCSQGAQSMTGSILTMDGGWTAQ